MEYVVGDRYLNMIPQKRLSLINVSILNYLFITNSPKRCGIINQEDKFLGVPGDIEVDKLGSN